MSRVEVGDRVRGLVGGFWMTWCVLFFCLFVLGDLLGRGGRVEVPVWERRMDALGLSRLRVQQGKSAKTSVLRIRAEFWWKTISRRDYIAAHRRSLRLYCSRLMLIHVEQLPLLLSIACPDGSRLCIHRLPNHDISEFELSTLSCPIRTDV